MGDSWADKRVLFHCNNQAVTSVWDLGLSRSADLKKLVRSLFFIAAKRNFHVLIIINIFRVAIIPLLILSHACRWKGFESWLH